MSLLSIFLIGYITQSRKEAVFVICIVGIAKAFEAVSDIFHGLQQKHEKMKYVTISLVTKAGISLLAFWATIHFTHRLLLGCLSLTAAWGMVLFAYDIPMAKRTDNVVHGKKPDSNIGSQPILKKAEGISFSDLQRLAWLSLPLGVVGLLSSLGTNVPRYFVEIYLGKAQLGIFAGMDYIIYAGHYLVNSAGNAVIPRMARYFGEGKYSSYRHLLFWSFALVFSFGFLIIFVSILFGRTLLGVFYGPIYAEYVKLLILLSIAGALEYINLIIWHGITASWHFRVQPVAFGIHVVSISLFCFFLIPQYSLVGVGYSLICSNLIQFVIGGSILTFILGRTSRQVGELIRNTDYKKQ